MPYLAAADRRVRYPATHDASTLTMKGYTMTLRDALYFLLAVFVIVLAFILLRELIAVLDTPAAIRRILDPHGFRIG